MNGNTAISGGCQCGAVRYRIAGPLGDASICHCRMCQKAFGNFGAALVTAPVSAFSWTRGQPAAFRSSSIVAREFCPSCGTPLTMREDGADICWIAAGSLDDPESIPPMARQVGVESKLAWFDGLTHLPTLRTDEDRTPADLARLKSLQHPDRDTEHWP